MSGSASAECAAAKPAVLVMLHDASTLGRKRRGQFQVIRPAWSLSPQKIDNGEYSGNSCQLDRNSAATHDCLMIAR